VVSAVAGSPSVLETVFLTGAPDGPVVAQALGERVELALLPSAAAAALAIDELLHLTDVPVESGQGGWAFSLGGYAALLALADGVQRSYLEARLARRPYPRPSFTAEALQGLLDDGLAATDTRWAVTAAKLVTPVDLASARDRLASGMDELVRARLAERGRDGSVTFTEQGYEVAAPLGQLLAFGTVTVRVAVGPERTVLGHTTVLRGMFRIFLGTWTFEGEEAQVRLTPVSALTAIEFVRGMFEAAVSEAPAPAAAAAPAPAAAAAKAAKFCPQCGTPVVEGRRFCGSCGTELKR
jgi:hypothetical protein